jgi:hypothetical protein
MEVKHTLSDVLKRLVVDIDNMNSFLYSLENILESKSENVSVNQTKADGSAVSINVPSFGYLKGKIEDINNRFDTLLSTNADVIGIKSSNGEVRKFELKKTSQLLTDLENIQNSSITLPTEFGVKNNWFFESFLNPLLYVNLDIANILTDDIDSFVVKRIIVNSVNNDDTAAFFDANYKGRNDISLDSLKLDLDDNAISYFEDDNVVDVETAVNRFRGSFDVLRILEEETTQTLNNQTTTQVRRRYKLSTLTYTDALSGVKNSKILAEGDILITLNDSEYRVLSVNKTDTEVVLERIFGLDPITIGANILRIKPLPYRFPQLQVNVGFNERQVLFIRPISKAKNLTIDDFSNGVAVYTNELTIPLTDNTTATLASYYTDFVSDFGLIFLNMAKEKKVPSILGQVPLAPTLSAANFNVVQVDQHIQDDENTVKVSNSAKEKASLEKEIQELNKQIDDIKANITTVSKTQQESKRLEKKLSEVQKTRDEKTVTLSTVVTNLTLQLSTTPQFINSRKYAVRGFWQIPEPVSTEYGAQKIVQFKYRYRYLNPNGNQAKANQLDFVEADGTKRSATFSPWTEEYTKPRIKSLNPTTGLYEWDDENVSDADSVNSNQLSIAIRKGEIVEIQIKSLSEAGWPENPVESEWSTSVQVPFPENISSQEESIIVSQKAFADKTKIDFERSLIARGLDTHLANQFTTGDKFFAHKADDISSGFFTNEGNVINLYEQLKTLKTALDGIQQSLSNEAGVIKVSVIDPAGTSIDVANGDTVSLFAGYYKDQIKDTTGGTTVYREGKIITKQYIVSIQNTATTQLELISLLFGGMSELANTSDPVAYPSDDYHVNRRYDQVPISVTQNVVPVIGSFNQAPSSQSGQVKSQYINSRIRNYGLSEEMYFQQNLDLATVTETGEPYTLNTNYATGSASAYFGQTISGTNAPFNWGHYLPYAPQYAVPGSSTDSRVWNGTTSAASTGQGGGRLTEFCISRQHPHISTLGASYAYSVANMVAFFRPVFNSASPAVAATTQKLLPFAHALHFETSVSDDENIFGVKYYAQAARVTPVSSEGVAVSSRNDSHYPIKLGFTANDEYLIGKYTCGAYLYMSPQNYQAASVEGNFPARSTKSVKFGAENAINIPVIFQYRCSDQIGKIGGHRLTGDINNVKYTKKIGIDIILKDDSPFSFDIEVSAQYNKETSLDAPLVQARGNTTTF